MRLFRTSISGGWTEELPIGRVFDLDSRGLYLAVDGRILRYDTNTESVVDVGPDCPYDAAPDREIIGNILFCRSRLNPGGLSNNPNVIRTRDLAETDFTVRYPPPTGRSILPFFLTQYGDYALWIEKTEGGVGGRPVYLMTLKVEP